jgi:hypothetical protein
MAYFRRQKSMWACLPAGPLERRLKEGNQGDFGKRFVKNLQEGVNTFLGWVVFRGSLC